MCELPNHLRHAEGCVSTRVYLNSILGQSEQPLLQQPRRRRLQTSKGATLLTTPVKCPLDCLLHDSCPISTSATKAWEIFPAVANQLARCADHTD